MSNFPTARLVLATVLSLFLTCLSHDSQAAGEELRLSEADSLFAIKKYTESLAVYESILEEGNYSPSMLLKMAYINEGLGDVSGAMFYLNLYYLQTSNKRVLAKLGQIAEENQLIGYEFGDYDFFLNIYGQYKVQVIGLLLAISLALLATLVVQRRKTGKAPYAISISYMASLGLLFYLLNYGFGAHKGIIIHQQTYLMTGPSGGADVVGIIEKGHRVDILEQVGVWIKILWDNQEVYVRESKIRSIS